MRRVELALSLLVAGCAVRPARFVDRPPIEEVADDRPIPRPRPREPVPEVVLTEAYLKRPLVRALEPGRVPDARDVNALDEVPRSSWFSPNQPAMIDPPKLPFRALSTAPESDGGGLRVIDARGRGFELRRDPADRPEMRTAAGAIAGRLLRSLGWFTADAWVIDVARGDLTAGDVGAPPAVEAFLREGPAPKAGRYRVLAVRWPIGLDVGPTSSDSRGDDPNDRVPHADRRTLRALKAIFGWLGITHRTLALLHDGYVGEPGKGHVVHYLVGLDGALGADAVIRPTSRKEEQDDIDLAERNVLVTLVTLGLYRPKIRLTQTRWPSIGEFDEQFSPGTFGLRPPFEPIDRTLPADAYWAAKRLAALPPRAVEEALDAGKLSDPAAKARLAAVLQARRLAVIAWAFGRVTPCEVERVEPARGAGGGTLVLRDEAVLRGFAPASATSYRVELLDANGRAVPARIEARASGAIVRIALPEKAGDYLIVRVLAVRGPKAAPRPFEAHLARRRDGWAVIGIRR